jgi:hypothetical protein
METYFKAGKEENLHDLLKGFEDSMNDSSPFYLKPEKFVQDINRGIPLLTKWYETFGKKDMNEYEILEVEKMHKVPLDGTEFFITLTPDRVMKRKSDGKYYIFEVKTTGYSASKAAERVAVQEQASMYLWGLRKAYPDYWFEAVIPDVLYNRGKVYSCERAIEVYRSKRELHELETGLRGVIGELSQKVKAINDFEPIHLFPRRFDCDGDGAYTCEYRPICRTPLNYGKPPIGYQLDTREFDNE